MGRKVKVNADGVGYSIPNPVKGQPDLTSAGYRGEVIEVTDADYDRLRSIRVRVFYDDPVTGRKLGAFREEPSIVDATDTEAADHDAAEKVRAEVRELEDKLAEARNRLPLVQSPSSAPVPLSQVAAAVSQPRELPASDDLPRPVTDAPEARAVKK